ncbi:MAG: hypothetical protein NTV34_19775 [Proteobacteria bacterium]|nr:hypothetical protein [Pseudomonadota bacterium]
MSKAHPNLDVIRTDYDINETTVQGKVKSMHLDTAMPFKIPDKSQDIVVMRRGTCYCHENACGGMDIFNQSSITSFMLESARVLRTTKPGNGVFYLNNREGKEQSLTPWVNGAKTVMNLRKDIEVQILVTDFGRFDGIAMVPSKPSKQINGTSAD